MTSSRNQWTRGHRRAVATAVAAVLAVAMLSPGAGAVDSERSSRSSSGRSGSTPTATTVSRSSATRSAETDVASLRRDRDEVRQVLEEAKLAREDQFRRWILSNRASEEADLERVRTVMLAEQARRQVVRAERRVRKYASEAFMHPPTMDTMAVLSIGDPDEMSRAHSLMSITAEDQRRVVDELAKAKENADFAKEEASLAATEARRQRDRAKEQLLELDRAYRHQEELVEQVDRRLDAAMAEAAALRAVDRRAAERLAQQEQELADEAKATVSDAPEGRTPTTSAPRASAPEAVQPRATSPATTSAPTTTPPRRPTSPRPTSPPTTTAPTTAPPATTSPPRPPSPPSNIVRWQDVTKVGGIWVNHSIAGRVRSLLNAASASGISLGGGGYRDPNEQIRFRQAHCGPTQYDIYQKPASQCRPPTAPPGRSMHERGLAIDFTSGGSLIKSRSNPAFQWLAANAASYGFYNLPSEPWHWSTNGN